MEKVEGVKGPYQGKDIVSKILVDTFGGKAFEVYGLKGLPAIKAYLPTDLPPLYASDKMSDHVFLLEDGSYAIVDYESSFKSENKVKYLEYATQLIKRYFEPGKEIKIRIIVIYTCDVDDAEDTFDAGALKFTVEQAFLSHIDGDEEYGKIKEKIANGEELQDEDLMRLVILPLTKRGDTAKTEMIDKVITTVTGFKKSNENGASFVLSAMLVAMGNYITEEQENRIKEVLDMTTLGRRYEREKRLYGDYCKASAYVELVDKKMQEKQLTLQEACAEVGIAMDTYQMSKSVIESADLEAVAV